MENVNNTYFDGYYKDIWKALISPEFSQKEADFIFQYFNLTGSSHVLDIMCGYGRHAIALGKKGVRVTAVDNLDEYITEIKETALHEQLPVTAVKADIIIYEPDDVYDVGICMGNSLCFFDRGDTLKILKKLFHHLKPGGVLFINTWMLAEIVFTKFREREWSQIGDVKLIIESKYLLQPSRVETEHMIVDHQGNTEFKKAIDYIYSIAETEQMLMEAGFSMTDIYSVPGRKRFSLGDSKAYIIARKPKP